MKTINEYCLHILCSGKLEEKLLKPPENLIDIPQEISYPNLPIRDKKISFGNEKSKIPRLEHLNQAINRAICLHHFANHELMAIELFAYALLKFQNIGSEHRKDLFLTLQDEQKHLTLYLHRMRDLGLEFGERPLNFIFWKFAPLMTSFEKFSAIMSITFEGANLDFALIYKNTFLKFQDKISAEIMDVIYHDERKHVRRGVRVLEKREDKKLSDWEYYLQLLDKPLTPRRAKGYFYIPETRRKLGLSEEFIQNLAKYRDEFSNRKKEVIPEEILAWGVYTG
jgi:uncharacterized ferritin-like protein (DUF455 family)